MGVGTRGYVKNSLFDFKRPNSLFLNVVRPKEKVRHEWNAMITYLLIIKA